MNELDRQPVFITPTQLVERWGGNVKKATLANWRSNKQGPPFAKMGRTVLYPLDELEAWERAQQVSTA